MIDLSRYEWLSFDCYGTLVDWESGIFEAIDAVLASHGVVRSRAEILEMFSEAEPRVQGSGTYLEYREALRRVMVIVGERVGVNLKETELGCLADSLPDWPIFPEVPSALNALRREHKLAVISNVDDDLFAGTAKALGVEFEEVVTAQQVGSYKPNLRNFSVAKARMGVEKPRWLHVAESLFHDIKPANELGIGSVWVNRPDRGGGSRFVDASPGLAVPDLTTLVSMV